MKTLTLIKVKQGNILAAMDEAGGSSILAAKEETLGFLLGQVDSPALSITEHPTDDEGIGKLIEAVREDYKDLPEYSMFRDPNWKTRDAIIEILEWAKG